MNLFINDALSIQHIILPDHRYEIFSLVRHYPVMLYSKNVYMRYKNELGVKSTVHYTAFHQGQTINNSYAIYFCERNNDNGNHKNGRGNQIHTNSKRVCNLIFALSKDKHTGN